jgi:hypothetical protein
VTETGARGVTADYAARREEHLHAAHGHARVDRIIGAARVVCFIIIVVAAAAIISREAPRTGAVVIAVALAALVGLIAWHDRVRDRLRLARTRARNCEVAAHRVARDWNALPPAPPLPHAQDHAFADDLYVTGDYSLLRLLPAVTPASRAVLGQWLLAEAPPPIPTITERQRVIRQLAPSYEWREQLAAYAADVRADENALDELLQWADGHGWLRGSPVTRWTARILTVATIAAIIAAIVHLISPAAVVALLVANGALSAVLHRRLDDALTASIGQSGRLAGYARLFRQAHDAPSGDESLRGLLERTGGAVSADAIAALDRLARFGEARYSPMAHFALQVLVLWDFHVIDGLEGWQLRHGRALRTWLGALTELEAIAALATLAYENPDWTYPTLDDALPARFDASALAHPLLAPDVRVANDLTIGEPQPILLVTGSNMAGKTTLLRAIGLNVVLANAGAPVCAARLRVTRLRVRTSINASDAPERGLSLYMAELLRVRSIVEAAHAAAACPLLYLGDELLRGTNAVDRRAALVLILRHLVRTTAIGVIATHDPEMARDPELAPHVRPVHLVERFREGAEGSTMWFDYTLRPGLASSSNAIKLLELVGLNDATLAALEAHGERH